MNSQVPTHGKNDTRFDDLLSESEKLGGIAGQGEDVQVKHLLLVTQAAFECVIDNTKNKHGTGRDDATVIAEKYWGARHKNVIFNPKAGNQRKTISCFRQVITMGGWSKGGPGEPMGMLNRAMTMYKSLRKVPGNTKRMIDPANYVIALARKLRRSDYVLDDATMNDMAFKKDPDIATVADVLDKTRATLKKLYEGKHPAGSCSSIHVDNAIKAIDKELKEIVISKQDAEQAEAVALAAETIGKEADKVDTYNPGQEVA
jgi:hypothetical protein